MKDKSQIANRKSQIFLGVDGGQSHTEAIIGDEHGNILGRGFGGASNHAEVPGGRERLKNAIVDSVSTALKISDSKFQISDTFTSAHFGMTGGADYKEEIIGELIKATYFKVGHDAPIALFGATAGKPGIVVISGTGSVVYGENASGETAQIGGLGFLFSDEGSGFWLAAQTIRLAIKEQDGLIENSGVEKLVLDFFKVGKIRDLTTAFYNEKVSRDEIAALAKAAHGAAENGNELLQKQIKFGSEILIESVKSAANKLQLTNDFPVAGVGGMFRGALMRNYFAELLSGKVPKAKFIEPVFGPVSGALLLAYRQANIEITQELLANLENSQNR
jgi:N-acetylglucosamine kinase-like BadF-type ATPase